MPSILGLGIIESGKAIEIWESSRSKVIPRAIAFSLLPIVEELIKERLGNLGIIEKFV